MSDPYEDNLRHLAEPATPTGREQAVSTTLASFEALWLAEWLDEYAYYGDHPDAAHESIAKAYAVYIERQVYERRNSYVTLYAHTELAAETLIGTLFNVDSEDDVDVALFDLVSGHIADLYVAHQEDAAPEEPTAVEDLEQVEFSEGAAMEAENDRQIHEAESEWEREQEELAAKRGVSGLPRETNPAIEDGHN